MRPRRSVLFMPGTNARALEKARTPSADVLVLDLEDAVAPEVKVEAPTQVFAPAAGEVGWARRVIEAHAAAVAAGRGVAVLDGRLIENLHVDDARRVLALADAIAERAQ